MEDILFNSNTQHKDTALLNILISITGGEFENLYKGKEGMYKGQPAKIVGFIEGNIQEDKRFENISATLNNKKHNRIIIYPEPTLSQNIFTSIDIKFTEFTSIPHQLPLFTKIYNQDPFRTISLLIKLLNAEIANPGQLIKTSIQLYAFKVKLLKAFLHLISSDENIARKFVEGTYSEGEFITIINNLLTLSNNNLGFPAARCLHITEQYIEYLRTRACETDEYLCINKIYLRPEDKYLVLNYTHNSLNTYKCAYDIFKGANLSNLQMKKNYYMQIYNIKQELSDLTNSMVIIPQENLLNIKNPEILANADCIITEGKVHIQNLLKNKPELQEVPIICLLNKDFQSLVHIKSEISKIFDIGFTEDMGTNALEFGGFEGGKVEGLAKFTGSLSEIISEITDEKNPFVGVPEVKGGFNIGENMTKLNELMTEEKFLEFWESGDGSKINLCLIKEEYLTKYQAMYLKEFNRFRTGESNVDHALLLKDMEIFYWRHIFASLLRVDKERKIVGIIEGNTSLKDRFLRYMKIMMLEGTYEYYAFKNKELRTICTEIISTIPEILKYDLMNELIIKELQKLAFMNLNTPKLLEKTGNLFKSSELQILSTCNFDFIRHTLEIFLNSHPTILFQPKIITNIFNYLLANLICMQNQKERYQILHLMKTLLKKAIEIFENLSPEVLTIIFTNELFNQITKAIRNLEGNLLTYMGYTILQPIYKHIWIELMLDITFLFKKSQMKHRNNFYCIYVFPELVNDLLFISDLIQEMPTSKKLLSEYIWMQKNKKLKRATPQKIESAHTIYDTTCVGVINNLEADIVRIKFSNKFETQPNHSLIMARNIDGKNGTEITEEDRGHSMTTCITPNTQIYCVFPVRAFTTYAFGIYGEGRLGVIANGEEIDEDEDNIVNYYSRPEIVTELEGYQIRQFETGPTFAMSLDVGDNLFCTGEGEQKLGENTQTFTPNTDYQIKNFASTDSHTVYITSTETPEFIFWTGNIGDGHLGTENKSDSIYKIENPNENANIKQLSTCSKHTLLVYTDGRLYGCSNKGNGHLFGVTEGESGGVDSGVFREVDVKSGYKVEECLAVSQGTIILVKGPQGRRLLLGAGEKGALGLGMGGGGMDNKDTHIDIETHTDIVVKNYSRLKYSQ